MTNNSTSGEETFVSHDDSVSMPKGLSHVELSDRLVVFHCNEGRLVNPGPVLLPDVASAYLPCTGRVDLATVLSCFRKGALGVLLAGCPEGACRFPHPNGQCSADVLVSRAKRVVYMAGWDPRRVSFFSGGCLSGCGCSGQEAHEGSPALEKMVEEMIEELKELGVQPLSLGGLGRAQETHESENESENGGGEQSGEHDSDGWNSGEQHSGDIDSGEQQHSGDIDSGEQHSGGIERGEQHRGEAERDGLERDDLERDDLERDDLDSGDTDSGHGLEAGEAGDGNGKAPGLVEEQREIDGMEKKIEDTRSGGEQ